MFRVIVRFFLSRISIGNFDDRRRAVASKKNSGGSLFFFPFFFVSIDSLGNPVGIDGLT